MNFTDLNVMTTGYYPGTTTTVITQPCYAKNCCGCCQACPHCGKRTGGIRQPYSPIIYCDTNDASVRCSH